MSYCRVLIVDDEVIIRQGLKYMLDWEREGFEIVGEASNGEEGLDMIKKLKPHIVLSDVVMPVMDGIDFANIIKRMYPQIFVIMLSGYDNFEYVKNTLLNGASDYLLKPSLNPKELLEVLKKTAQQIPGMILHSEVHVENERILARFLLGFETETILEPVCRQFTNSNFRLILFEMKMKRIPAVSVYEQVRALWGNGEEIQGLFANLEQNRGCLLVNHTISQEKMLFEKINWITERMCKINSSFFTVVSERISKLTDLKKIYIEHMIPALKMSFYAENIQDHILILDAHMQGLKQAEDSIDYNLYTRLLVNRKYKEALYMLEQSIKTAITAKTEEIELKNQTKNMIYNYLGSAGPLQNDENEWKKNALKKIDEAANIREFQEGIDDICGWIRNRYAGNGSEKDGKIEWILQFINENYAKDIDLKIISEKCNYNYYYISTYFSQCMHETFSDYLNRIRIEKACDMLRAGRYSISQISQQVGYSDQSYFSRVFRKIMGVTPSEYRREN